MKPVFCFDVESMGLYGDGFAVGGLLYDEGWNVVSSFRYCCAWDTQRCTWDDRNWLIRNLPPLRANCESLMEMRAKFWEKLVQAREYRADIVVDCGYPVETAFLRQCVLDDESRSAVAPYPLHDLATALAAAGRDPVGTYPRNQDELPLHDPLRDAMQTARLWKECVEAK